MTPERSVSSRLPIRAAVGGIVWVGLTLIDTPPLENHVWVALLLLFAPLVLVPLALDLLIRREHLPAALRLLHFAAPLQMPAALLLALSLFLASGIAAMMLVLPWLAVTALVALAGVFRFLHHRFASLGELAMTVGMLNLAAGGGWTLMTVLGTRPLGFAGIIVLLTSVHFHYAGFILPVLAGQAAMGRPSRLSATMLVGVIGVMPAVAIGITAAQLGAGPVPETIAAAAAAIAGLLVGARYLGLAVWNRATIVRRGLFALAGLSLCGAMILAGLYGLRFVVPVDGLTIPAMWGTHGMANAIGFSLCGLLGWLGSDLRSSGSA